MGLDLNSIIDALLDERTRIDRIIKTLEATTGTPVVRRRELKSPRRAGRKSMGEDERREVAERMRRYWASRRKSEAAPENETPSGDQAPSGNQTSSNQTSSNQASSNQSQSEQTNAVSNSALSGQAPTAPLPHQARSAIAGSSAIH